MPEKQTVERAKKAKRQGKAPTTQAGEFVREEIHHIREGKHGARSAKQAIAIGLSKARRAGVDLKPPKKGRVSEKTRRSAEQAYHAYRKGKTTSARRSVSRRRALAREGSSAASKQALSKQTRSAAQKRSHSERSAAARRAATTKGRQGRSAAAKKAARTRARRS
jgi:hypothetical protein